MKRISTVSTRCGHCDVYYRMPWWGARCSKCGSRPTRLGPRLTGLCYLLPPFALLFAAAIYGLHGIFMYRRQAAVSALQYGAAGVVIYTVSFVIVEWLARRLRLRF